LIRKLQRLLNERGHGELNVDGVFGPATLDAVLKYQRGAGLAADGLVGHRTLASLQSGTPSSRSKVPPTPTAPPAQTVAGPVDDVHNWPAERIVFEVFRRAGTRLPSTMLAQWNAFATKENAKWMLGIVAVGAIVQFIPGAGEVFDGAMVGLFLVTAGPAAFEGGEELGRFLLAVTGAATEPDIDTAAEHLARAVTLLGVTAVLTWLQRRAVRGSKASGAAGEEPAPAAASDSPIRRSAKSGPPAETRGSPSLKRGLPDLSTEPGKAFFWSGLGRSGANAAAESAKQGGGTTLEMLLESRGIKMPVWDASNPTSVAAWKDASASFAQGASGDVRVVLGGNVSPTSIWQTTELPALRSNPNVTSIISVDASTGAETTIFSR
jgi:hypothetical protein